MKKEFYAVVKGRNPGIYRTWEQCRQQVSGFSGAIFKGFAYREDADAFMNSGEYSGQQGTIKKSHAKKQNQVDLTTNPTGIVHFYTGDRPPWEFETFIGCYPDNLRIQACELLNEAQRQENLPE